MVMLSSYKMIGHIKTYNLFENNKLPSFFHSQGLTKNVHIFCFEDENQKRNKIGSDNSNDHVMHALKMRVILNYLYCRHFENAISYQRDDVKYKQ